jgi:hypothetical protein
MRQKFEGMDSSSSYDAKSMYGYPVRWGKSSNMEAVTHTFLGPLIRAGVGAYKTLDGFDYSIEHLSLYERRLGLMTIDGSLRSRTVATIAGNLAMRARDIRKEAQLEWGSLREEPVVTDGGGGAVDGTYGMASERDARTFGGADYDHGSATADGQYPHRHYGWLDARTFTFPPPHAQLSPVARQRVSETIVLMPFYGVGVGTGHSIVSTRFAYLNLTFWSHFRIFPHIGVVVGTPEDYDFVTTKSGLPFAEVVSVVGGIRNGKNMGLASGMAAQHLFRNGTWSQRYKYMYWTESDQVLIMRDPAPLYALVEDGEHMVVPHRFLPFPRSEDFGEVFSHDPTLKPTLQKALARELRDNDAKSLHEVLAPARHLAGTDLAKRSPVRAALEGASCCFDAGDCARRDQWRHFSTENVYMMRFSPNMGIVNGEANIFHHTWRTCAFHPEKKKCDATYTPGRSATD